MMCDIPCSLSPSSARYVCAAAYILYLQQERQHRHSRALLRISISAEHLQYYRYMHTYYTPLSGKNSKHAVIIIRMPLMYDDNICIYRCTSDGLRYHQSSKYSSRPICFSWCKDYSTVPYRTIYLITNTAPYRTGPGTVRYGRYTAVPAAGTSPSPGSTTRTSTVP